jgi:uncharacterized membrane protein (UPF0127 family)
MRTKIGLKFKNRKIEIQNVKKVSEFGKIRGLMFRSRKKCPAMLFEFNHPTRMKIHSLFVFFPFAAIWLDDKNSIIDLKIVKPFELIISCKKPFYKLVEIPFNQNYKREISLLFKKM